jgi:hypothetical protein
MPPFGCVREHCQAYFTFLQVCVKNHSDLDLLNCMAQARNLEENMLTMEVVHPQSAPRDFEGDGRLRAGGLSYYKDMYNGNCISGVRRVPQSSGVYVTEDPVSKAMPTFLKSVAAFAALWAYLEKENVIGALPVGHCNGIERLAREGLHYPGGVSLKRLSDDSTSSAMARLCNMEFNRFSFLALETVATMKALI